MAKYPIFYLWLYRKIRLKSPNNLYVAYTSIKEILNRSIPWTPRKLYFPIIKDLEKFGLVKRINKSKYELLGNRADLDLNRYDSII